MTFCELPLWEICIPRIVQAEEILIGCFVECQSIKKVGGRRSVEELYQALFFVSPVPPECFTQRNEQSLIAGYKNNRAATYFAVMKIQAFERCYTTGISHLGDFDGLFHVFALKFSKHFENFSLGHEVVTSLLFYVAEFPSFSYNLRPNQESRGKEDCFFEDGSILYL